MGTEERNGGEMGTKWGRNGDGAPFGPEFSLCSDPMRLSRYQILSEATGNVHVFWRCHDRKHLLDQAGAKKLFFQSLVIGLQHRGSDDSVKLHAFCLMDNHVHQQMSYSKGVTKLSHVMRVAHGIFGQRFNKKFNRSGKVANERPKTPLVGGLEAEMRVHFYIEANPIRAGMTTLQKLRFFFWSSYRFYGHGIVDEPTKHLTPPQWYLDLGKTPAERQRAYRELFRKYLEQTSVSWGQFLDRFIGSPLWIWEKQIALKKQIFARTEASARASPA